MEHARHEFILTEGINFTDLHNRGIDTVVARIEMAFKTPLRSGDEFVCKLHVKKEGIKYVFFQDIFRLSDNAVCIKAKVEAVAVINGKLSPKCEELDIAFAKYF